MDVGLPTVSSQNRTYSNNSKARFRNQLLQSDIGNIDIRYEQKVNKSPIPNSNPNFFSKQQPEQQYLNKRPMNDINNNMMYANHPRFNSMQQTSMPQPQFQLGNEDKSRASSLNQKSISNFFKNKGPNIHFKRSNNSKGRTLDDYNDDEDVVVDSSDAYTFNDIPGMGHREDKFNHNTNITPIIPTLMTKQHTKMNNTEYRKHTNTQKKINYATMNPNQRGVNMDQNGPRTMSLQNFSNNSSLPLRIQQNQYIQQSPEFRSNSLTEGPPNNQPNLRQNFGPFFQMKPDQQNRSRIKQQNNQFRTISLTSDYRKGQYPQVPTFSSQKQQIPKIYVNTDFSTNYSLDNLINLNTSKSSSGSEVSLNSNNKKPITFSFSTYDSDHNSQLQKGSPLKHQVHSEQVGSAIIMQQQQQYILLQQNELKEKELNLVKREDDLKRRENEVENLLKEKEALLAKKIEDMKVEFETRFSQKEKEVNDREIYLEENLKNQYFDRQKIDTISTDSIPITDLPALYSRINNTELTNRESNSTFISTFSDSPIKVDPHISTTGMYKLENTTDMNTYVTAQEFQELNNVGPDTEDNTLRDIFSDSKGDGLVFSIDSSSSSLMEDTFDYKDTIKKSNIALLPRHMLMQKQKSKGLVNFGLNDTINDSSTLVEMSVATKKSMSAENRELTNELSLLSRELAESIGREISLENKLNQSGDAVIKRNISLLSIDDFESELRTKSKKIVELIEQLNSERVRRIVAEEHLMSENTKID